MARLTSDTVAMAAGERIRRAREARKLSLRDLGDKAGLDFGYVGKVERGSHATLDVYLRLADALGLSVSSLMRSPRKGRKAA